MYSNNVKNISTQNGLQTTESSLDTVCQDVFNPASRDGVALQSNSKSAQDVGWPNNGGGMHHANPFVTFLPWQKN